MPRLTRDGAIGRVAKPLEASFGPFANHECLVLGDDSKDAFVAIRHGPGSIAACTSFKLAPIDTCAGKQHFKRYFKGFGDGFHDLERWIGLAGQQFEQKGWGDSRKFGKPASAQLSIFECTAQIGDEDVVVHDCRPF